MEEFLGQLKGKKIDVNCGGGAAFCGEVVGVENGILRLKDDEDLIAFVAVDKILFFVEKADPHLRPGFII